MALVLSESEQVAVMFEVMSTRSDWVYAHIAFQHYVSKENDFATWVEGFVDVYRDELTRLVDGMRSFVDADESVAEFSFEPVAEPSFELRFRRCPPSDQGGILAFAALDIKRVLELTIPAAYRDNRVSLQLRTNEHRVSKFVNQLFLEADRVLCGG